MIAHETRVNWEQPLNKSALCGGYWRAPAGGGWWCLAGTSLQPQLPVRCCFTAATSSAGQWEMTKVGKTCVPKWPRAERDPAQNLSGRLRQMGLWITLARADLAGNEYFQNVSSCLLAASSSITQFELAQLWKGTFRSSALTSFELCHFKVYFFALFLVGDLLQDSKSPVLCFLLLFFFNLKRSNNSFSIFAQLSQLGVTVWVFSIGAVEWHMRDGATMYSPQVLSRSVLLPFLPVKPTYSDIVKLSQKLCEERCSFYLSKSLQFKPEMRPHKGLVSHSITLML